MSQKLLSSESVFFGDILVISSPLIPVVLGNLSCLVPPFGQGCVPTFVCTAAEQGPGQRLTGVFITERQDTVSQGALVTHGWKSGVDLLFRET